MRTIILLAIAAGIALSAGAAHASSWLTAAHDAQHTNFNPTEHTISAGNVSRLHRVWSFPGLVQAVATDRRVYGITGGLHGTVVVLDAHSGQLLHRYTPIALHLDVKNYDDPRALAYANGRLVIGAQRQVLAISPGSGKVLWRVPGGAGEIMVGGQTVYTGKGCQNPCGPLATYAIDLATGRVRWTHPGNFGQLPALVAGRLYQTWGPINGWTRVYDSSSGTLLATLKLFGFWLGNGSHAYVNVLTTGMGAPAPHSWIGQIGPTGKPIWKTDLGKADITPPVLAYGMLYTASFRFNPGVVALDASNGRLRWASNIGRYVTLAAANHLLFALGQETGKLTILQAGTGKTLRAFSVPGYVYRGVSNLLIAGGTLYVLDGKSLAAFRP